MLILSSYFQGLRDIYKTTDQKIGIMEAFLKKYGLNESEISEFKEHALSVNTILPNRTVLHEKFSKLTTDRNNSKGKRMLTYNTDYSFIYQLRSFRSNIPIFEYFFRKFFRRKTSRWRRLSIFENHSQDSVDTCKRRWRCRSNGSKVKSEINYNGYEIKTVHFCHRCQI